MLQEIIRQPGLELTQQLFPMGRGKWGGGGDKGGEAGKRAGGKAGALGAKAIPSRRLFPRLASVKGRHCSQGENQNTQD